MNHLDIEKSAESNPVTRRELLTIAAGVVGASSVLAGLPRAVSGQVGKVVKKGRIKQSICRGCLRKMKISRQEEAAIASRMGLLGLDLVGRGDWDAVKKHGLVATMVPGAGGIEPETDGILFERVGKWMWAHWNLNAVLGIVLGCVVSTAGRGLRRTRRWARRVTLGLASCATR